MKIYLDQNVWEHLIDSIPSDQLKNILGKKKINVCLSMHNIYEFGRCFLKRENTMAIERGKKIFTYIFDIFDKLYIIKPTKKLIELDLIYAATGGRLLDCVDYLNVVATKAEIFRLSQGWSNRAEEFIGRREKGIRMDEEYTRRLFIRRKQNNLKGNYISFRDNWEIRWAIIAGSEYRSLVNRCNKKRLFMKPEKYPFINTYINAVIYADIFNFSNRRELSFRVLSDYRHIIDSNAANEIISNDKTLNKRIAKICPYITTLELNEAKTKYFN